MRRLKLQMQMSLDGFVSGAAGEMDWLTFDWDEELKAYVRRLMAPVDGMLMSHKMAGGFIPHWEGVAANPEAPDFEAGRFMTETPKFIFSRTQTASPWKHSSFAGEANAASIGALKAGRGGDLIVYGGAGFVSSLIAQDLIDEYHLFVNPVALGRGMPIFAGREQQLPLHLTASQAFPCGIVVLAYHRLPLVQP